MTETTWTATTIALSKLKPWERNPKRISKAHAARLLDLWERLGQFQTIAIGPGGEVYDGHQRLSVLKAKHGGSYVVQVLQASRPLTEAEREELTIAAHSGTTGSWDWDALAGWDVGNLTAWGLDEELLKDWNAGATALREMLAAEAAPTGEDPGPQVDKAAELQAKWQTATGQLWQLGEHRLICGDCTDKAVVERVMGGEKARCAVTSPPYSNQRDYEVGDFDWQKLARGFSTCLFGILGDPGDAIVNLGLEYRGGKLNPYWNEWLDYCASIGHPIYGWYVWDKGSGFPGEWNGRLAPAHEWVFHFSNGRKSANKWIETTGESAKRGASGKRFRQKDGSLNEITSPDKIGQPFKVPDSVVRITREMARGVHTQAHPAVFPVEFAEFLIQTWSDPGGIVYEPFSGSGTTLIACERLGRRCRACEIEPSYVGVALERWATMTGQTPVLVDGAS
jgi:DNA modification methylase